MEMMKFIDITDEEYEMMKSFDYDDETNEEYEKELAKGEKDDKE